MQITLDTELYSSKNSKTFIRLKNGRTVLVKSKQAAKQDKILKELLNKPNIRKVWVNMISNKTYPIKLGIYIYRRTRVKFDYINIVQGLFDMLVKEGYIPDDDSNTIIPVFLGHEVDKENPRVILSIL